MMDEEFFQKIFLDAEEEKKKNEMRATAKKEMSDWYNQREDRLVKTKMLNRFKVFFFL